MPWSNGRLLVLTSQFAANRVLVGQIEATRISVSTMSWSDRTTDTAMAGTTRSLVAAEWYDFI